MLNPLMPATIPQLNRALLGTLMSRETANIVSDRIEELEAENAKLRKALAAVNVFIPE